MVCKNCHGNNVKIAVHLVTSPSHPQPHTHLTFVCQSGVIWRIHNLGIYLKNPHQWEEYFRLKKDTVINKRLLILAIFSAAKKTKGSVEILNWFKVLLIKVQSSPEWAKIIKKDGEFFKAFYNLLYVQCSTININLRCVWSTVLISRLSRLISKQEKNVVIPCILAWRHTDESWSIWQ